MMNKPLVAATILTIQNLENNIIAAALNALSGLGKIHEANLAYDTFLQLSLINDSGQPHDSEELIEALSHVVNERIRAGTFE